jgi:acyl carrier protein
VSRAWLAATLLAAGVAFAPPAPAVPPAPYHEILETTRELAAGDLGREPQEIDTTRSLLAQGMNEKMLRALVIELQQEFGVVIPDDELRQARWNDPVVGLSVRRIADMVVRHMRAGPEEP